MTLQAFKLCRQVDINFIGNVEGHDLFHNRVDVVVCDGFVGNIVLKTLESFAKGMVGMAQAGTDQESQAQARRVAGPKRLRTIKRRMDPEAYGGAPLLGLNGNVMKAHGSARERAIMNAIRVTTEASSIGSTRSSAKRSLAPTRRLAAVKTAEPVPPPYERPRPCAVQKPTRRSRF